MAKMICMACSLEFPSDADYLAHKTGGHKDKSKGAPLAGPGAEAPTPEFIAQVARIEGKAAETAAPSVPERPQLPDPKPIKLTYVYTGDCPTCRNPISTLELDVPVSQPNGSPKKIHFVVAHCIKCNQQLESREEKKL